MDAQSTHASKCTHSLTVANEPIMYGGFLTFLSLTQGHVYPSLYSKLQGRSKGGIMKGGERGMGSGVQEQLVSKWKKKKKRREWADREQRDGEMERMSERE